MPAEPAPPAPPAQPAQAAPPAPRISVGHAIARYTGLRLALMAVLSLVAWVAGIAWLPAIAVGVIAATAVSVIFLRASTRRLSAVLAAASARNRAARPALVGPAAGDPTGDLYDFDPYADDEEEASDPDDLADQQQAAQVERTSQVASTNARPTSSP